MKYKAGKYSFECTIMPWTAIDMGIGIDDVLIIVSVELSEKDIQTLVQMMRWAWDNDRFENSTSETVFAELLKQHAPELYKKIYQLAHQQFCEDYPNSENVNGFGVYEIFPPDEILDYANEEYEKDY